MTGRMIMDYPVTLDVLPDIERDDALSEVDKAFNAAVALMKARGPWNEALHPRDGRGRFAERRSVLGALQRLSAAGKLGGSVRDVVVAPRRNPLAKTGPADSRVADKSGTIAPMTAPTKRTMKPGKIKPGDVQPGMILQVNRVTTPSADEPHENGSWVEVGSVSRRPNVGIRRTRSAGAWQIRDTDGKIIGDHSPNEHLSYRTREEHDTAIAAPDVQPVKLRGKDRTHVTDEKVTPRQQELLRQAAVNPAQLTPRQRQELDAKGLAYRQSGKPTEWGQRVLADLDSHPDAPEWYASGKRPISAGPRAPKLDADAEKFREQLVGGKSRSIDGDRADLMAQRAALLGSIDRHRDKDLGTAAIVDVRDDFPGMTDEQFGDAMRDLHRAGSAHFRYDPPKPPRGETAEETARLEQEWSDNKRNFVSVGLDSSTAWRSADSKIPIGDKGNDADAGRRGFNRVGNAKTGTKIAPTKVGEARLRDKAMKDEAEALAFMAQLDMPAPINNASGGYRLDDVKPGRKVEFNMGVENGGQRTGRVWADAPKEKGSHVKTTVWVIPDERREGEPAALAVSLHTRSLRGGKRSETGTLEYADTTTRMGELLRQNPRPTPAEEREHSEAWRARMAASRMTPDEKVAAAEAREQRRAQAVADDPLHEATKEQRHLAVLARLAARDARTMESDWNYQASHAAHEAAFAAGLRQRADGMWEVGERGSTVALSEAVASRGASRAAALDEARRISYSGERDARIDEIYAERHAEALKLDQDDEEGRAELYFAESGIRARGLTRTDLGYERDSGRPGATVVRPAQRNGPTGRVDQIRQAADEEALRQRYSRASDEAAMYSEEDFSDGDPKARRAQRQLESVKAEMVAAGLLKPFTEPTYEPRTPEEQARVDAGVAAARESAAKTTARIARETPAGVAPEVPSGKSRTPAEQRKVDLDSARSALAYASGVTHPQGTINPGRVAQLERQIRALESPLPLKDAQEAVRLLAQAETMYGANRKTWTARQKADYAKVERRLKTGK